MVCFFLLYSGSSNERLTKKLEKLIEHPETDPKYKMMDRDVSDVIERLLGGLNL